MKKILIFSNREQIGDGIIKLPFLYEVRVRFPNHYIIWATNSGSTVFNSSIKEIADNYIDEIYEKIPLSSFFCRKKNDFYQLDDVFDIIIDTQKAVIRSLALKRLKSKIFISSSLNWFLSDIKPTNRKTNINDYYLNNLFKMLDLIKPTDKKSKFNIIYPNMLNEEINKLFDKNKKYFGFAPGSATKERIWRLENFIKVANYFDNLNYTPTFFLGPDEKEYRNKIKENVKNVFFPEELIKNYSGPMVVMALSNFLHCALTNDSGTSQMLSVGSKNLFKIIGPTSNKFTPKKDNFYIIDSKEFGNKNVNSILPNYVISKIEKKIN